MNRFSECYNKSIAVMAFYFQHKDDENKSEFSTTCCKYGFKELSRILEGQHIDEKLLEQCRVELMEEAANRYSSLFGLYDVSPFSD